MSSLGDENSMPEFQDINDIKLDNDAITIVDANAEANSVGSVDPNSIPLLNSILCSSYNDEESLVDGTQGGSLRPPVLRCFSSASSPETRSISSKLIEETGNRKAGMENMVSMSEMNAMDVSALNSMLSMVMPTNKGNSNVKREWRNVGWFKSEAEMNEVRKRQKVSKWKSVDQINGLKVFFRCNKWKRTNCNYRMYVMYYATDRISLNESGEHDHSTLNLEYKPRNYAKNTLSGARAVIEATPSSSQQLALDQLIQNATASSNSSSFTNNHFKQENNYEMKNFDEYSSEKQNSPAANSSVVDSCNGDSSYLLSDSQSVVQLLQLAAELDLTFTYNSRRNNEYCYESNAPEMQGKMVAFFDSGNRISVIDRIDGFEKNHEEWNKADWSQFLWAVRGKCVKFLKVV